MTTPAPDQHPQAPDAPADEISTHRARRGGGELTRSRLLRFGGLIIASTAVCVAVSLWTSTTQQAQQDELHRSALGLLATEQSISDGEAIRAGVLGMAVALQAGDTAAAEESVAATQEAFVSLRDHLSEAHDFLDASADAQDGVAALQEMAVTYEEATGGLLTASTPISEMTPEEMVAVRTVFDEWSAQGTALREQQELVSDLGEELLLDQQDHADLGARQRQLLIVLSAIVAIGVFVVLGRKVLSAVTEMRRLQQEKEAAAAREHEEAAELQAKVDSMLEVLGAAAQGDLTRIVDVDGDDAVGHMGQALSKLLGDLRSSISGIASNSEALAAAAEELQVVSVQMGANAAETSSQVNVITESSADVSRSVETVSTGAEEMSASIKEIARNASDAAKVASQAVEAATVTNETVSKLGESSAEIGEIVKVITGIAQQTNLLALNATIEAARAGEAGKGFAVVANEVKELAKETAKATEDISSKIEAIQSDTQRSVEAITGILGIINQIAEFQDTIASAVEQQAATTSEIARSVTDASRGSTEITANMQAVASAAESTSSGAGDSQRAASELAHMAAELQDLVGQFTY